MGENREIMSKEEIRAFVSGMVGDFAARIENVINRARPQEQLDTRALEISQAALTKAEAVGEQINRHLNGHDAFYTDMRESLRRIHTRIEKIMWGALIGALGLVGYLLAHGVPWKAL